jgi:CDP-paratose 2-epimerase
MHFDTFLQRRNQLASEVFNIGRGRENTISLLELLDMLEQLTGKRSRISFSADISKAREKLGWISKINHHEGENSLTGFRE